MMPGNCTIESEIIVWILDEFGSFFSLFPSLHCRTDAFRLFFFRWKQSAVLWKVIVWLSFAIRIALPMKFFTSKNVVEFVYVFLFIKTIKSYGNGIFVVSFFLFRLDCVYLLYCKPNIDISEIIQPSLGSYILYCTYYAGGD